MQAIHLDFAFGGGGAGTAEDICGEDVISTLTDEGKNLNKRCLRAIEFGNRHMRRSEYVEAYARFTEALLLDQITDLDGGGGIPFKSTTSSSFMPDTGPHVVPGGAVLLRHGRANLYVNRGIALLHLGRFEEAEKDGFQAMECSFMFPRARGLLDALKNRVFPRHANNEEDIGDHSMIIMGNPVGSNVTGYTPSDMECIWCGATGVNGVLQQCAGCRAVSYCNRECQRRHWRGTGEGGLHRVACTHSHS